MGSGGPRGFAHIGVLKVLDEMGVRPDVIVGSSVGAMVGILYAAGYDARRLERLSYDLDMIRFYELRQLFGKRATGRPLEAYVNELVEGRSIEQLGLPVPVRAARRLGAQVVIAVDVSAYAESTPPGVPQKWIDKDRRRAAQVADEVREADVFLHPDIGY